MAEELTTSEVASSSTLTAAPEQAASEGAASADAHDHEASQHNTEHAHPSDWQYIKIALLLAVLTALEVFTYFESVHNLSDAALYVLLTVLMVLKFVYVVAWFMHLKFDSMIFRRVFQVGIVMALAVYLIMLTAFEIW